MRKLLSLMLVLVMGISWSGSPVRAEDGNPVAPPSGEPLPGMTEGQNEMASGMENQTLEGMQAQAAAMEPQAPETPPPPPKVSEEEMKKIYDFTYKYWKGLEKVKYNVFVKKMYEKIKEQIEKLGGTATLDLDKNDNLIIKITLPNGATIPGPVFDKKAIEEMEKLHKESKENAEKLTKVTTVQSSVLGGASTGSSDPNAGPAVSAVTLTQVTTVQSSVPGGASTGSSDPNAVGGVVGPASVISSLVGITLPDIIIDIIIEVILEMAEPDEYPDLQPPVIEEGELIESYSTPDLQTPPLDIT